MIVPKLRQFISTHDLTRRSTKTFGRLNGTKVFQLTTSRGGRRDAQDVANAAKAFQLTTSRGGRPVLEVGHALQQEYFNSRPHEEVDMPSACLGSPSSPFQLTTSRGGRPYITARLFVICYFNSRPHEEVDSLQQEYLHLNNISTHDLTRRSTYAQIPRTIVKGYFNSRPHEEVDYTCFFV